MHLLWEFGLQAWIAINVAVFIILAVAYALELRRIRHHGDRPW